jgi:hypothetical protein
MFRFEQPLKWRLIRLGRLYAPALCWSPLVDILKSGLYHPPCDADKNPTSIH